MRSKKDKNKVIDGGDQRFQDENDKFLSKTKETVEDQGKDYLNLKIQLPIVVRLSLQTPATRAEESN